MKGHTTVRRIVKETAVAIWRTLQPEYMPHPTEEKWKYVASRYWELWNLPNCIGSLDGKHIRVKCPPNTGSAYFNYKGYFSVVLLAVSDADGKFVTVDVGEYGRNSDGRALKESKFGKALQDGRLQVPNPTPLPGDNELFPYFSVADEAFPLTSNIMKPYPKRNLNNNKRIFNGRLSRGRKSVECAFGMMASKFQVLHTPINCSIKMVDDIILALCVLHNFIRHHEGILSTPSGEQNVQETVNEHVRLANQNRPTNPALLYRDKLCDFFLKPEGALAWQEKYYL